MVNWAVNLARDSPPAATGSLYLLMGIKSAEVCASLKIFFCAGHRLPGPPARPVTSRPSNLLMHIDWAKTSALAAKNYSPVRR
jgi:hypothetical protein